METMILDAGLAVAGLAGIAAAFYFSMRPGGSRARTATSSRSGDNRVPAGRSRTSHQPSARPRSADPARSAGSAGNARSGSGRALNRTVPSGSTGSSTVIDFTGPQPVLEEPEPLVSVRRARHGDRSDDTPDEPGPSRRVAARHAPAA